MKTYKLGEIAEINYGIPVGRYEPKNQENINDTTEYKILSLQSLEKNYINKDKLKSTYIFTNKSKTINKHTLKKNTIILGTIEPFNNVLIEKDNDNILASRTVLVLKIKDDNGIEIIPKYLSYYLNSENIKKQFMQFQEGTNILRQISTTTLEKVKIEIPPPNKQKEYIEPIDILMERIQLKKEEIKYLEQLSNHYINMGDNDE